MQTNNEAVLREALIEAAAKFRYYEIQHRAKNTDDSNAKAEVNADLAGRFESIIAATATVAKDGGEVLSASEQRAILKNPVTIAALMDYHDDQQSHADSVGADCTGNQKRFDELREIGRRIVSEDAELWPVDIKREFLGTPTATPKPEASAEQPAEASEDLENYRYLLKKMQYSMHPALTVDGGICAVYVWQYMSSIPCYDLDATLKKLRQNDKFLSKT